MKTLGLLAVGALLLLLLVFGLSSGPDKPRGTNQNSTLPPRNTSRALKSKAVPLAPLPTEGPGRDLLANQEKDLYTILVLGAEAGPAEALLAGLEPVVEEADRAACLAAQATDPSLTRFFQEHQIDPAVLPKPVALVVAPNNVITGTFMKVPSAESFARALLPEQPLAIRKALAEGKVVIVTAQSATTAGNHETMEAIDSYLNDPAQPKRKEQLLALPLALDNPENAVFLEQLGIGNPEKEAQSLLIGMAPPLKILSKAFRGAADEEAIDKLVSPACATGCAGGT